MSEYPKKLREAAMYNSTLTKENLRTLLFDVADKIEFLLKVTKDNKNIPDPNEDGAQFKRAKRTLIREYGNVIGDLQAENIVYNVLLSARAAVVEESAKSEL